MIKTRIENKELMASYHDRRCVVCGSGPCDPAHIKTNGSGGDDAENNLMPLCRRHHTEQHKIGISTFATKYKQVVDYLNSKGWEVINVFGVNKVRRKIGF